jgi:hypothetical protein
MFRKSCAKAGVTSIAIEVIGGNRHRQGELMVIGRRTTRRMDVSEAIRFADHLKSIGNSHDGFFDHHKT